MGPDLADLGFRSRRARRGLTRSRITHILGQREVVRHMTYSMHQCPRNARLLPGLGRRWYDRTRDCGVRETGDGTTGARTRTVRWIESMWEGTNTTAREEDRKEEVLSLFRELARESKSRDRVHEYVPWQPLW